jgi:hypothetical protein
MTRVLARVAVLPLALLLISATRAEQVIRVPGNEEEALIVPYDSPVKFRYFDGYGVAHFTGRFILTGTFTYECADCESGAPIDPPAKESDITLEIVPDATLSARLPHWKVHKQDVMIDIRRASLLRGMIASQRQRADLLSGKLDAVRGRVAITIEDFQTDIECDSAGYWANFVSVVRPPKLAQVRLDGNYGCA